MEKANGRDYHELFRQLAQAVGEWEASPYYMPDAEIFDLERFLDDRKARELRAELEEVYGTPLNQKFWPSFLIYHRLRRAREEIKSQEGSQEERSRRYLQALEDEKKAWQEVLKDWSHHYQRQKLRVIPGGKKKDDKKTQ